MVGHSKDVWFSLFFFFYVYHIIIIIINHAPLEALSGDLFSGKKTKQTLSQPQMSSRRRGLVIQMRVPVPVLPQALTLDESLNISVPWFLHLLSGVVFTLRMTETSSEMYCKAGVG